MQPRVCIEPPRVCIESPRACIERLRVCIERPRVCIERRVLIGRGGAAQQLASPTPAEGTPLPRAALRPNPPEGSEGGGVPGG